MASSTNGLIRFLTRLLFAGAVLMVRLYASKPGATLELRYDPVPGGFEADVPYETIGRTWAPVELGGFYTWKPITQKAQELFRE